MMDRRKRYAWGLAIPLALAASMACGLSSSVLEGIGPTATHTMPPTASPTATPDPYHIQLDADGSGDYATLSEAVKQAPEGGEIALGPGEYLLDEPLDIGKAMRIMGAGMEDTEIAYQGEDFVLRFNGMGPFELQDLTIHYAGEGVADVVIVEVGEIDFQRVRFTGSSQVKETRSTAGLYLRGEATGKVEGCEFVANDNGVRLEDNTQLELVQSMIMNNRTGVRFRDDSGGLARENEITDNGTGFVISDEAEATIEENVVRDNGFAGFSYGGNSGGTAYKNVVSENGFGFYIASHAQPTIAENVVRDNILDGITYWDNAGGVARANECVGNLSGILVDRPAAPELVDNDCHDNLDRDIGDWR